MNLYCVSYAFGDGIVKKEYFNFAFEALDFIISIKEKKGRYTFYQIPRTAHE